MDIQYI